MFLNQQFPLLIFVRNTPLILIKTLDFILIFLIGLASFFYFDVAGSMRLVLLNFDLDLFFNFVLETVPVTPERAVRLAGGIVMARIGEIVVKT